MFLFLGLVVVLGVLLYAPGILVLAKIKMPASVRLASAPLASIFAYVAAGILVDLTIGRVSGFVILALVFAVAIILYLVERKFLSGVTFGGDELRDLFRGGMPYLLIGVAVTFYVFCTAIPSYDAYIQIWDNLPHLGMIKSFSSGRFSILHNSYFLEAGTESFDPAPSGGFYPAALHIMGALLVNCFGVEVTLALNALLFCSVGVMLPLSVYSFVDVLFEHDERTVLSGSSVPLAFVAFPWRLFFWGPLYPNMLGFCLVLALGAQFLFLWREGEEKCLPLSVFVFVCSSMALGAIHPNALFLLGCILAPMIFFSLLGSLPSMLSARFKDDSRNRRVVALAFAVFVVVVWTVSYNSSFMSGIVHYVWPSSTSPFESIVRSINFAYIGLVPQYLLMVLASLGFVRALCDRKHLWLCVSFAACSMLYIIDASIDGPVRQFFTGFWYTDEYRTAACAVVSAIPLVVLGIDTVLAIVVAVYRKVLGERFSSSSSRRVSAAIFVALVFALYFPLSIVPPYSASDSPIGWARGIIAYMYNIDVDANATLTREERDFLLKVHDATADGGMILNIPQDGSAWGYATCDLELLYRTYGSTKSNKALPEGELLRNSINTIATDSEVKSAADRLGVRYVLLLDQKTWGKEGANLLGYDPETWNGLFNIKDDTPGFEVVLAEKDMRLYRITA